MAGPDRSSPRARLAISFAVFSCAWLAYSYLIAPGMAEDTAGWLSVLLYDGWSCGMALVAVLVVLRTRQTAWIPLAGALVGLAIGDLTWDLAAREVIPTPSGTPGAADAFYLAGYGALAVTAWLLLRRYAAGRGAGWAIDALIVGGGLAAAALPLMIRPFLDVMGDDSLAAAILYPTYPALNLLLAAAFGVLALATPAREPARLVAIGIGFCVVADEVFAVQNLDGGYTSGGVLDWLWLVQYTLMAMAVTYPLPAAGREPAEAAATADTTVSNRVWLLIASAGLSPLLLLGVHATDLDGRETVETMYMVATLLLVGLVCARLVTLLQGQRQTSEQLTAALAEGEKLTADLNHQARHDAVTGLPNRYHLAERADIVLQEGFAAVQEAAAAAAAAENGEAPAGAPPRIRRTMKDQHSVVFLDLDDFKAVNDTFGHSIGDMVLRAIADRIRQVIRPTDIVARLGGDEFAVLLPSSTATDGARVAQRMLRMLQEPLMIGGRPVAFSASAGVADLHKEPGRYTEALAEADIAMYAAKRAGKNRVLVYSEAMRRDLLGDADLAADLARAISEGEIDAAFQPVIELTDGRASGLEALARWRHPDRGDISPAEFLPLATERGLISGLDLWIMDLALRRLVEWRRTVPDLYVGFNASAATLARDDLAGTILRTLAKHGLPGDALLVEVTEQSVIDDTAGVARRLQELREHGVQVALDDFGTGYSSLSSLEDLPVDVLKLDRSFLDRSGGEDGASPLVRTVVQLGHELGMQVVAEGIETRDQFNAVREVGCDLGQGWLLARPMPSGNVQGFLESVVARTGSATAEPDQVLA